MMDAAVPALTAADVGNDVIDDFEARGGGGRQVHAQPQPQPPRRPGPTHVSLLSRAIHPVPRSVFADHPVRACHYGSSLCEPAMFRQAW